MSKFHYKDSPTPKQKAAFSKYLSEDEELILVTGVSSAYLRNKFVMYMLFPGLLGLALGLGFSWMFGLDRMWALVLSFGLMFSLAILKTTHVANSTKYLLTTRRVIIKHGVFAVKITTALYDKITHIELDQSFLDRILLHHGNIIVNTAGMSKDEISLNYVDYPLELKNLLERLINRERERFGSRGGTLTEVEGEIIS